jgi:hypothetical protein
MTEAFCSWPCQHWGMSQQLIDNIAVAYFFVIMILAPVVVGFVAGFLAYGAGRKR